MASLLISFAAAFSLINAVPSLMVNIIQGNSGSIQGPTPGLGTRDLSGPAKTRI
jgi:hypothetical protein